MLTIIYHNKRCTTTLTPFTEVPGPKVSPATQSLDDSFHLFFDDSLLRYLTRQTNQYTQKKISAMQVKDWSLYRNWRPVTQEEMMGFLSVVFNIGIMQHANLKEYWSTNDTMEMSF